MSEKETVKEKQQPTKEIKEEELETVSGGGVSDISGMKRYSTKATTLGVTVDEMEDNKTDKENQGD